MKRPQWLKYEMLMRVRAFGLAHQDMFPEGSVAREALALVLQATKEVEEYLDARVRARADAGKVKAATRRAVHHRMKVIVQTARRSNRHATGQTVFRLPTNKSTASVLSTARVFLTEAERQQSAFTRLGLLPAFLQAFRADVDALQQAVNGRHASRSDLNAASAGIAKAIERGFEAARDLDVIVGNAIRDNPAQFAAWQAASRVDSISRSTREPESPTASTSGTPTTGDAERSAGEDGAATVSKAS